MAEKKQDIAPDLLNRILTSFGTKLRGNEKLAKLADKLQNGTAAYADAYEYALEVGTALSDTFGEELSSDVLPDGKMYFNIANRVVRDPLTRAFRLIADECEGVQEKLNTAAGIGLKAQRPDYPENRIKGFIDRLSSEPDYDKVSWMLKEPVKTFSESIVDDSVKKNAEMHYNAGLSPQIIRTAAAGCCEWCTAVEGKYRYPDVPKDIYRRHKFCRCQVEYDPRTGRRQDVHTRKWSDEKGYGTYREVKEANKIASHKNEYAEYLTGLRSGLVELNRRQRRLLDKVPERLEWKILNTNQVSMRDIAALTAKTGDEFAIFHKGRKKALIHGYGNAWSLPDDLLEKIQTEKWTWEGHSHPIIGVPKASAEDRAFLRTILPWQKKSAIINLRGEIKEFTASEQDWFNEVLGIR